MADLTPRPLPLVTADGPVCQEACQYWDNGWCHFDDEPDGSAQKRWLGYYGVCLPALREAWLREQRRQLEVCGRCRHWEEYKTTSPGQGACQNGYWSAYGDVEVSASDYCSQFDERKDGE